MRVIVSLFFLFVVAACTAPPGEHSAKNISKKAATVSQGNPLPVSGVPGFDTAYILSGTHSRYLLTGYFNIDSIQDTALLVRHKATGQDALFVKHGGTMPSFLFESGKALEQDFENFNWVGQFEVIQKGSTIWNNVIDGEIVGEDQVPANKKIRLETDAIFMHEDEGGGGGIVYFTKGKYVWVQQD